MNLPNFTPGEVHGLFNEFEATELPKEKARIEAQGAEIGQRLRREGGLRIDGVGQKMCEIPVALYVRLQQQFPGCWEDRDFVDSLLKDNPQFLAPGYKPTPSPLRHAFDMGRHTAAKD